MGTKGFVTDAMVPLEGQTTTIVYACGPEPMLRAVHDACAKTGIHGQFSFEERMACGFGACMGCSLPDQVRQQAHLQGRPGARKGGDPMVDTHVTLSGWTLDNPVIPASGTFRLWRGISRAVRHQRTWARSPSRAPRWRRALATPRPASPSARQACSTPWDCKTPACDQVIAAGAARAENVLS